MIMWKLFSMFVSWGPFDYGHQTMKYPPLVTEWNMNFTEINKWMNGTILPFIHWEGAASFFLNIKKKKYMV